jgi:hypothetical protein
MRAWLQHGSRAGCGTESPTATAAATSSLVKQQRRTLLVDIGSVKVVVQLHRVEPHLWLPEAV